MRIKLTTNAKKLVLVLWVGSLIGIGYGIGIDNVLVGTGAFAIFIAMTIVIDKSI